MSEVAAKEEEAADATEVETSPETEAAPEVEVAATEEVAEEVTICAFKFSNDSTKVVAGPFHTSLTTISCRWLRRWPLRRRTLLRRLRLLLRRARPNRSEKN